MLFDKIFVCVCVLWWILVPSMRFISRACAQIRQPKMTILLTASSQKNSIYLIYYLIVYWNNWAHAHRTTETKTHSKFIIYELWIDQTREKHQIVRPRQWQPIRFFVWSHWVHTTIYNLHWMFVYVFFVCGVFFPLTWIFFVFV